MASTTADSIPVIDLRLLTQSEINNLALSSPNSFNLETLSDIVPKIDRSVFNESAGSRKQTYSRLPLFQNPQSETLISQSQTLDPPSEPPNPQSQPLPRRRGRPRVHPLPATPAGPAEPSLDLDRQENLQIVSFLKKLFESRGSCSYIKNNNVNVVSAASVLDWDKEVRNGKGETVDLVVLAGKEDLYGEEIRRRTDGLQTEEQLLGYMTGLDGQWGSRRKKRKVVDAAVFGDGLPKGWKILLGLKRKDGIVYLNCRRYVRLASSIFLFLNWNMLHLFLNICI